MTRIKKWLRAPVRGLIKPTQTFYRRLLRLPSVHRRALLAAYGPGFRQWCESEVSVERADRDALYSFLVEREGLDGPVDYLEFGVFEGMTIRWWVEHNPHPESRFVGFDSFEGLPEAWGHAPIGTYSANGKIPDIADPRCSFVKGLFHDTLPSWLAGRDFSRRIVLHLDADLYSSTLLVLGQMLPKLKKDDIIIFDEIMSYIHEYRALVDATSAYPIKFKVLAHTLVPDVFMLWKPAWCQVAIKVTDCPHGQ
jgi:O-methyltransferase